MSPVGWSLVQGMLAEHRHGERGAPKSRFLHSTEPGKIPEVLAAQTSLGEAVRSKETSVGTVLQPHLDLLPREGLEGNGKLISTRSRIPSDAHQPSC